MVLCANEIYSHINSRTHLFLTVVDGTKVKYGNHYLPTPKTCFPSHQFPIDIAQILVQENLLQVRGSGLFWVHES
jgi:hypothetical protein